LNECTSTHRQCSSSSKDQKTPRRLIDITSDRPKLIEDHGLVERYVCLSHCWGEQQPLRTTTATIQKHKHEIAWDAIPRTFQDAIQIMKRLHINYIWIDSLCIVQDDADDWAAQAAQMANIYSNAFLTIAATCAPDSTHGLFSKTPDIYLSETFHIPRLDGSSYPVRVRHLSKFHMREHYNEHSALAGPPATWPLLKRAWVFQERLLSPRLLHFSFGELIWERRHVSACECSAIASQQKVDHNFNIRKKDVFHFHLKRRIWGAEMDCTMWHDIVAAYTGLQLSLPKDVFPALSGIALSRGLVAGYAVRGSRMDYVVMGHIQEAAQHLARTELVVGVCGRGNSIPTCGSAAGDVVGGEYRPVKWPWLWRAGRCEYYAARLGG
jgi:hypothetical protein